MTATIFDCEHCEDARGRLADLEATVARLTAENRWMRKRVQMPGCERCKTWGGHRSITGHRELHGFEASFCPYCWRDGETFELRPGVTVTNHSDFDLTVHHADGDTRISFGGTGYIDKQPYAATFQLRGLVHADGFGSGVMCRANALLYVVQHLPILRAAAS